MLSEVRRLLVAVRNSVDGWAYLLRHEPNIRYLLALILLTTGLSYTGLFSVTEAAVLLLSLCLATGLEIFNTALEDLANLSMPQYHYEVKNIKDMVSGAVFFSLIIYVVLMLRFIL